MNSSMPPRARSGPSARSAGARGPFVMGPTVGPGGPPRQRPEVAPRPTFGRSAGEASPRDHAVVVEEAAGRAAGGQGREPDRGRRTLLRGPGPAEAVQVGRHEPGAGGVDQDV